MYTLKAEDKFFVVLSSSTFSISCDRLILSFLDIFFKASQNSYSRATLVLCLYITTDFLIIYLEEIISLKGCPKATLTIHDLISR